MLTDDEKRHILLQEQYRAEVRDNIDSAQTRGALSRFVNSNFGLWLLSAVFITGLGGAVTWYTNYLTERSRIRDRVERFRAVTRRDCSKLARALKNAGVNSSNT